MQLRVVSEILLFHEGATAGMQRGGNDNNLVVKERKRKQDFWWLEQRLNGILS